MLGRLENPTVAQALDFHTSDNHKEPPTDIPRGREGPSDNCSNGQISQSHLSTSLHIVVEALGIPKDPHDMARVRERPPEKCSEKSSIAQPLEHLIFEPLETQRAPKKSFEHVQVLSMARAVNF